VWPSGLRQFHAIKWFADKAPVVIGCRPFMEQGMTARVLPVCASEDVETSAKPDAPLLADSQFRAVWLSGIVIGIVRWLEFLAVGIFAYDVTGSAFLVALLALLRFLPLALFGIFMGALADISDNAKLLRVGFALAGVVSVVMTGLFVFEIATYWHVALAVFASGTLWATDLPVRRKLIGEIAGLDRLAEAMAIDTATSNGTRMVGPLIGGLAYQWVGGTGIFALGVVFYALAWVIMGVVKRPLPSAAAGGHGSWFMRPITSAWHAFKYAIGDREVMSILGVTIVFNIWGFPMLSMVPVIGKEELGLSASTIGVVGALEGTCSFIGAVLIAKFIKPAYFRRLYYYGTCMLICLVFIMGILPGFWILAFGLMGAGFAGAGFATMQSTLIYLVAPLEMRGRLLGLITICIGSGLIGFANIGYLADTFGASNALWINALEGVIPMIWIGVRWQQLHGPPKS